MQSGPVEVNDTTDPRVLNWLLTLEIKYLLIVSCLFFTDAINKASDDWGIDCKRYEISKYSNTLFYILYKIFRGHKSFLWGH